MGLGRVTDEAFPLVPVLLALLIGGCLGEERSTNPRDHTPPAAVNDLGITLPTSISLTLSWTAPGDDGNVRTASRYDLRYSATPGGGWNQMIPVTGLAGPKRPREVERFVLRGLRPGTTYHFLMKVGDEVPNWSVLSNEPSGATSDSVPPPEMALVPAGTFTMGSPPDEPGRYPNETQHQVTLTRPFYLGKYEVTQADWQAVMGWNDSYFRGANQPVEVVTWFDAVAYCNERSTREGAMPVYTMTGMTTDGNHITGGSVTADWSARGYRLPTEAEWEYACRAGSVTAFSDGAITRVNSAPLDSALDQVGWYYGNSEETTHEVGGKAANAWGLEDMHGNVWEWCWDLRGAYPADAVTDPLGAASGSYHVERGGCWSSAARDCRSAARRNDFSEYRYDTVGFRVARTGE